jgi:hypothetical protein
VETVVEIVVAAGVLVAVVDVVAGAVDVLVAAVAVVDAMVVTAAVAEGGTKLLPRIFTDSTDRSRRIKLRDRRDCGPFSLRRDGRGITFRLTRLFRVAREDPSLRLKNGFVRDDAFESSMIEQTISHYRIIGRSVVA